MRAHPVSRLSAGRSIPATDDVLDPDEPVCDLPTVAELLAVPVTRVHQELREGHLLAVRRNGIPVVPRVFLATMDSRPAQVIKSLPGLLAVLRDGGYRDAEILRWLFTADPSLTLTRDGVREPTRNARPVDALNSHQAREVLRRAQAMAY